MAPQSPGPDSMELLKAGFPCPGGGVLAVRLGLLGPIGGRLDRIPHWNLQAVPDRHRYLSTHSRVSCTTEPPAAKQEPCKKAPSSSRTSSTPLRAYLASIRTTSVT